MYSRIVCCLEVKLEIFVQRCMAKAGGEIRVVVKEMVYFYFLKLEKVEMYVFFVYVLFIFLNLKSILKSLLIF